MKSIYYSISSIHLYLSADDYHSSSVQLLADLLRFAQPIQHENWAKGSVDSENPVVDWVLHSRQTILFLPRPPIQHLPSPQEDWP